MNDIEKRLGAARPSGDNRFAAKVARLIQPDDLKHDRPWMWSPGIGTDVWAMFRACILGDLDAVKRLVERDPSLVRAHYEYRTPLSFAVRENHLHIAEYLIDHGALNVSLGDLREMARDRGHSEMLALLERRMAEQHGASDKGEPVAEAIRQRDLAKGRRLRLPRLARRPQDRQDDPRRGISAPRLTRRRGGHGNGLLHREHRAGA